MKEFKVVKTTHKYSPKPDKEAYAIVVSTHLRAEPDAKLGAVNLEDPDDMYIIALDINEAYISLLEKLGIIK